MFLSLSLSSYLLFSFSFFSFFLFFVVSFFASLLFLLHFSLFLSFKNYQSSNKNFDILEQSTNNIDYRNRDLSVTTTIIISKILALVVGLSCVAIAFLAQHFGGLLQVCKICFPYRVTCNKNVLSKR